MISFSFKRPDLAGKLRKAKTEINLYVAAQMQHNRAMLFARSGSYNGHEAWAPLKLRAGQPLKDRGTLSQSMGARSGPGAKNPVRAKGGIVRFHGDVVSIGTTLHYAKMMNWGTTKLPGGVLTPKNKPLLWIPVTGMTPGGNVIKYKGKMFLLAKKVTIPARRFDNWTAQDKKEINTLYTQKIAQVLNR